MSPTFFVVFSRISAISWWQGKVWYLSNLCQDFFQLENETLFHVLRQQSFAPKSFATEETKYVLIGLWIMESLKIIKPGWAERTALCSKVTHRERFKWCLMRYLRNAKNSSNWHLVPVTGKGRDSLVQKPVEVDPLVVGGVHSSSIICCVLTDFVLALWKYSLCLHSVTQ